MRAHRLLRVRGRFKVPQVPVDQGLEPILCYFLSPWAADLVTWHTGILGRRRDGNHVAWNLGHLVLEEELDGELGLTCCLMQTRKMGPHCPDLRV